jgi:hypothetical protein
MSLNAMATPAAGCLVLGDPGARAHGGEGGLDRVGGAQVNPVLGGVIEGQQHVEVVGDLGTPWATSPNALPLASLAATVAIVIELAIVDAAAPRPTGPPTNTSARCK